MNIKICDIIASRGIPLSEDTSDASVMGLRACTSFSASLFFGFRGVLDPPDFITGYEFVEEALKLLQEEGASNLAPDLRAQIDETLEEINPRYVLELLGDEYAGKRLNGLSGVRNILWSVGGGGASAVVGCLSREKFMNKAFLRMTAAEQVDLFVATPSNIPAESFEVYEVALALVAQAFIGKKPHFLQDADKQFQQLQQAKVMAMEIPALLYDPRNNWEIDFGLGLRQ